MPRRRPDPDGNGLPVPALVNRESWLTGIDKVVESRYSVARSLVDATRSSLGPDASVDEVVDAVVKRYTRSLAAIAAVSGGAAAVPGVGTSVSLAAASADLAYTVGKLAELVLAIGIAHGHDATSLAQRKAWVLAVLGMGRGAVVGVDGLAGQVGARGGARLVSSITATQLEGVNSRLAARLLAKLSTEQAALRMGRVLPFGIGAGIGAAGNAMIVRSIAKAAREFFGGSSTVAHRPPSDHHSPSPRPRDGVIEATGHEVEPPVA